MATLTVGSALPPKQCLSLFEQNSFLFSYRRKPMIKKKSLLIRPVARLLGPAIFEASKPKVLLLEAEAKQPAAGRPLPIRTCTLTNSLAPSMVCKTKAFPPENFSWASLYAIILLMFILLLSFH